MAQPAQKPETNSMDAQIDEWKRLEMDESVSPGMRQYFGLKAAHPDYMLFYRMGDFYELFFDDAVLAADLLDIALTKRGKVSGDDIPMCGVPVHSSDAYLERLILKGQKVAVCEQLEDPAEAKKRGSKSVVMRDVVRIVTPGTLTEESLLAPQQSNYLACFAELDGSASVAWVDISTGEFGVLESDAASLSSDIARLAPRELLVDQRHYEQNLTDVLADYQEILTFVPSSSINKKRAEARLKEYYELAVLDAWGSLSAADLAASAALVDYILLTQKDAPPRLDPPVRQTAAHAMVMDAATRRNLELTVTLSGAKRGSLLHTIDRTSTAAGGRKLTSWLCNPLTDASSINARLNAVEWMVSNRSFKDDMRETLLQCPDMERSLSRLCIGRGGPRDIQAICRGLESARAVHAGFLGLGTDSDVPNSLKDVVNGLGDFNALITELKEALTDDVPLLARDGGFVAAGYHAALDEFKRLSQDSHRTMMELQQTLIKDTNISSLKIKHNNVLGHFIEVTNLHEKKVPESFIHRQTMKGALRYTTTELAEMAEKIIDAKDKVLKLELEIYDKLLRLIIEAADGIVATARALAEGDCYQSLATLAEEQRYARPMVDDSETFSIEGGRHPVVEAVMAKQGAERFISNGCDLKSSQRLWLLTGPNMAGKSTFLRQNALIAILAQMGSFVPADAAHIGTVDRLFSRVGAADDLARGRSTFMVEMVETATILAQSTSRSLVILDEIGRGTATFDGLSIAWAVVEHLHNNISCRGLFATHYHELTHLAETLPHLACHTMRVKEWKGKVAFLHEVKAGTADRSYGIHVARLAGLPTPVLKRAELILKTLEEEKNNPANSLTANVLPLFSYSDEESDEPETLESLQEEESLLEEKLRAIDPDSLTPRDALQALYELKSLSDE